MELVKEFYATPIFTFISQADFSLHGLAIASSSLKSSFSRSCRYFTASCLPRQANTGFHRGIVFLASSVRMG